MDFTEFKLHEKLQKGIADAGFITCMPVQEQSLVHTLKGRDVYVQSQTGTGKTAAFVVSIFQHFLDKDSPIKKKKALIITPTRELAAQIEKDAKELGKYLDYKVGSFYGGVGYGNQERMLEQGVDIIIGTPGRLLDLSYKKKMNIKDLGFVVIDEADRLFDMGFLQDIRRILDAMSKQVKRQTMLFSATMDVQTRAIAREYLENPARVEIEPEQVTVEKITQVLYHVAENEKINLMLGVLKKEVPRNALIFTNMKHTAAKVAHQLEHNGFKCQYISGDLPQSKRLRVINSFKDGNLPFLVATDVAARGLHIEDLELIINYDLPGDSENYVHRIGRTARAGKSGKAISLACENFVYNLEAIEEYIGMKIPVQFPGDDMFHEDKAVGVAFEDPRPGRGGGDRSRSGRGGGRSSGRTIREKTTRKKFPGKPGAKTSSRSRKPSRDEAPPEPPKKADGKGKKPRIQEQQAKGPAKPARKKKGAAQAQPGHKEQADRRHPKKKRTKGKDATPEKKFVNLDERLNYYSQKYGEEFKAHQEAGLKNLPPLEQPKKRTFLGKIAGMFKKGK